MKRFWLVLLSLGLIMAFSVSAYAVDVKFSGNMYAAGVYLDKVSLTDASGTESQSTAYYYQRLRLNTEFVAAPGLSVVTRADVMERIWGATRSAASQTAAYDSSATYAENENIAFDQAYIQWASQYGILMAGYYTFGTWATPFGNDNVSLPGLAFIKPIDKWMIGLHTFHLYEGSKTASTTGTAYADGDLDLYVAWVTYTEKNWSAGLLWANVQNNSTRPAGYSEKVNAIQPFFTGKFGNIAVQTEFSYLFGKAQKMDTGATDVDVKAIQGWVDVVATFGPVYVGGMVAYVSGDDPTDATEKGTSVWTEGGLDWSPTLIMWNHDRYYTFGSLGSTATGGAGFDAYMVNAWLYQAKVGVKPVEKLDVCFSVSYANAAEDGAAANWQSKDYGWEFDLTGTYKITNNLSYMLGAGYLLTGDYFKGTDPTAEVANDFLVINKLTLTF